MAYTEQPVATPQMSVGGGGNRNALNKSFDKDGKREWSYGLLGCFGDCGTCITSTFCPCIVYSRNKSRIAHFQQNGTPHPNGGEGVGGACAVYSVLCCVGLSWILQIGTRGDVRGRYSIAGGTFGDCLASCCCTPCELTQEHREIELEEQHMGKQA
ncbi:PLAC8-domain-containing protein [Cristinia sonorae]|uniref:PLAC8-domain-containing protein n=1 Tax=Cristinia sonorae TaxID=1940300 RepID=A0A8K0UHW2_9AGAR|nr:PLAC8-domain-containing protein [Cristinia sonorae]